MVQDLSRISDYIIQADAYFKTFAEKLRNLNLGLAFKMKSDYPQNIRICGVDGGFLKKEYHGCGLIMRRAVAVCFDYKEGRLTKVKYFPSKNPPPDTIITGPEFVESEFSNEANLQRVKTELETAIESINNLKPDVMILDGSIVIHPSSVPDKKSKVRKTYELVIDTYRKLYLLCKEQKIMLIGAVEDSRGKRFCSLLKKMSKDLDLSGFNDTLLLHYLLHEGERTLKFKYVSDEDNIIFKDLGGDWKDEIYITYLKPSKFDRPIRIEFLYLDKSDDYADKIAGIINHISNQNRYYCYPSVLIEADARAKLKDYEIDAVKKTISEKTGYLPALFDLRREIRPF